MQSYNLSAVTAMRRPRRFFLLIRARPRVTVLPLVPILILGVMFIGATASAKASRQSSGSESHASTQATNPVPASANPALDNARSLLQDGHVDDAEHTLRDYLKEHPDSAEAHFLLGYTLFRKVQVDASKEVSIGDTAGQEAKSRDEYAKESLAEFTEGAKYEVPGAFELKVVSLDYVLLKDYPDADKWLTKSLEKDPSDSDGWYYLGRTKYNENRFSEAISAFQQYLKLVPKSVKGEDNLGLSYQGLGRTEDATAAYRTAIAWQERTLLQDAGPFINLGALLLDENHPQEAIPYLQRAVMISTQETRAHEQLGKAYERLKQFPKAQSEFEKALQLAPQNSRLHYMLGHVYQEQGLKEKAKVEFDRSAALKKANPDR